MVLVSTFSWSSSGATISSSTPAARPGAGTGAGAGAYGHPNYFQLDLDLLLSDTSYLVNVVLCMCRYLTT
jgi:hypothetical protein